MNESISFESLGPLGLAAGDAHSFAHYRSTWTLQDITASGAQRWASAPALGDGTRSLTFAELHAHVVHTAAVLRAQGLDANDRVAVWASKSLETVVTMLGVSHLGATFVPLDPQTPPERLEFLLTDSAPTIIVVGEHQVVPPAAREVLSRHTTLFLDRSNAAEAPEAAHTSRRAAPTDVAYVLYTSGSTGKPKGVAIEHRQIEQFFVAHNARSTIGPGHRCLNTGPLYFDVFVLDILLPLWAGAFVRLGPALPVQSAMLRIIAEERITHFYAVGTILALMTGDGALLDRYDLSSLQLLQTGAEVCNPNVVNQWLQRLPNLHFLNSYGPTEVTVGCVSYVHPPSSGLLFGEVPIGLPHAGTSIAVVDPKTLRAVDGPGVVGELLLGGAQLMRGYLARPLEERRAFVTLYGERFYRTGDLVYLDATGQLYFRGRVDDEVKLNGHRIHPSELLNVLRSCPGITDAAAGVVEFGGVQKLAAVVVAAQPSDEAQFMAAVHEQLRRLLPPYMRPSHILRCDELPRTPTGKCDRRAALAQLKEQLS